MVNAIKAKEGTSVAFRSNFWDDLTLTLQVGSFRLDEHTEFGGRAGARIPLSFLEINKGRGKLFLPVYGLFGTGTKSFNSAGGAAESQREDFGVVSGPELDYDLGRPLGFGITSGLEYMFSVIRTTCGSEGDQERLDGSGERFRNKKNDFKPDNRSSTCGYDVGDGSAFRKDGSSHSLGIAAGLYHRWQAWAVSLRAVWVPYQSNILDGHTPDDRSINTSGHLRSWALFVGVDVPLGGGEEERTEVMDGDRDGVPDKNDKCPDTPSGTKVLADGCPPPPPEPVRPIKEEIGVDPYSRREAINLFRKIGALTPETPREGGR